MDFPQYAVFFLEEDASIPMGSKPLMLETMLDCPIMTWAANKLMADGVQRFFVVCSPRFAEESRGCFPAEADVTISEQQSDLVKFLTTPDKVLVMPRAGVPLAQAGVGFVYAASGYELQEAWKTKMTNAVAEAELVGGWLPIFGKETIEELEPLYRERGLRP